MGTSGELLLVLTNLPDRESAEKLAGILVKNRIAACANVLGDATSVYRWKGELETAREVPVLIKTVAHRYGDLEAAIRAHHPYELPEIIAVPITRGLPAYLDWVRAETAL
jgi:periplasmic divalent cation tolerance protein